MRAESASGGEGTAVEQRFPRVTETELRDIAWNQCGILRDAAGLANAVQTLSAYIMEPPAKPKLADFDRRNIHCVAGLIGRCALEREESRGAHFRTDFPEKSEKFHRPSRVEVSR